MTRRTPSAVAPLTIATINVNGLRAAAANGMAAWVVARRPDVVTMQEVRAPAELVAPLVEQIFGCGWDVAHHQCAAKGRAGVAIAGRRPFAGSRGGLADPSGATDRFDDSGRWVEADVPTRDGRGLTVVSCYVHTGEAGDPVRMAEKLSFLDAAIHRLQSLRGEGRHVLLTGDLNVGHQQGDIKNWKGNVGKAGFLPEERARFDRMIDALGWVDVGRTSAGDVAGPYTWWSWRGKAFDLDSGWRIDYHLATPELAATVVDVLVDRAPTYAERWSDHAPVVVAYDV